MPFHPEEYSTIMVDLTMDRRTIVLTPHDDASKLALERVIDHAPASFACHSGGMGRNNEHGQISGAFLNFGGECYSRTEGNATWSDYANAVKVHVSLNHIDDDDVIGTLRSYCWYGLEVDPQSTADSFRLIPTKKCKLCSVMLTLGEMEWQICTSCADKCEHEYTAGVGTANGLIADMVFCNKCGRAHPGWKPSENPVEDMLNTVAYGAVDGLILRNQDGSSSVITRQ